MDNKEYIQSLIVKAKKAQEAIDDFSQEKIDKMVKAMGMAIFDAAELLSTEAVEETKYGTVAAKIGKHKVEVKADDLNPCLTEANIENNSYSIITDEFKVYYPEIEVSESLDDTGRGNGGFGSSGL